MKTFSSFLFTAILLICVSTTSSAQFLFGMDRMCASDKEYAKVTIPTSVYADIIKQSKQGIPEKDACLPVGKAGTVSGYQADFGGDGTTTMWLLYHNGTEKEGCNVLLLVSPQSGGSYDLLDVMNLPEGPCLIRPIVVLGKGVQMYVQNKYPLPDGSTESRGAVLAYAQKAQVILTSWTQYDGMKEGKRVVQEAQTVFADMNFDKVKELLIQYNIYEPGNQKISDKNLVDQYLLTCDYVPEHMRYTIYDSTGCEKLTAAAAKAKAGLRIMNRDKDQGVTMAREALVANPFLAKERMKLGEFFLMDGKYGDAEKTLVIAKYFDPKLPKIYKLLGDTYLRLNTLEKALDEYQVYLEIGPKDTTDYKKVKHNVEQITIPKASRHKMKSK
jgi:hypothetical protein